MASSAPDMSPQFNNVGTSHEEPKPKKQLIVSVKRSQSKYNRRKIVPKKKQFIGERSMGQNTQRATLAGDPNTKERQVRGPEKTQEEKDSDWVSE